MSQQHRNVHYPTHHNRSIISSQAVVVVAVSLALAVLIQTTVAADTTTTNNGALSAASSPIINAAADSSASSSDVFTLTTLSGISADYAGVRSVASVVEADGVTTRLYFATLLAFNSSVSEYRLNNDAVVPIVQNKNYANCLDANINDFTSSTYPITPNGIAIGSSSSSSRRALIIADRTPSTHIFAVNSSSTSFTPSTSQYSLLVGSRGCSANVSVLADGAPVTSLMKDATYVAVDPKTGALYFTQRNAVFTMASVESSSVSYYFGNENIPGDRTTEPYGAIHRLAARTADPAQIFIDAVDSTMYVAETGMGTVRQINMANGNSSVVIGKFLSSEWPPASCTPSSPCAKSDVTFAAVTAVALYRPVSVTGQRWLFVADFTGAVLYKVVLETGVATVVAGQMLSFGRTNGVASVSKLFAPRSLAVGVASIFIADNSLRKLSFSDAATKAPSVISPSVVETTSNTVAGAIILGGIINPTVATQASRANVLISLSRCERSFGQLPPFTHLLQFGIGDDADFQYFVGAVVGNLSLCVGTLVVNAVVVFIYARVTGKTTSASASTMKFPSFVSLPLLFSLNPTLSVAVSLMAYANAGWMIAVGVLGFTASIIAFGIVTVYFVFFFEGHTDFEMLDKKFSGVFARMVNPVGEWLQTDLTGRMGMFFEDYLPSCWWFVIVELGMCVLSGIIEGIRPAEEINCIIAIALAAVLYTAFFIAMVLWQPYTVRLVFYLRAAIALLQVISAYLSLIAIKTDDPNWEAAGVSFALMSMYLSGVDAAAAILLSLRDLVHLFSNYVPEDTHAALRLHKKSSSSSSSEEELEFLEVPLINGSFTFRSANDTSVVHIRSETASSEPHHMPPRQASSSSSEEEDERRRKLRENRHEVLRSELTGLMNASASPSSFPHFPRDDASPDQVRSALAAGDYFLTVGNADARTPTPSMLRVKTISPVAKRRSSNNNNSDDDDDTLPPPPPANYSFVVGNGTPPLAARSSGHQHNTVVPSSQHLSVPSVQHNRTHSSGTGSSRSTIHGSFAL